MCAELVLPPMRRRSEAADARRQAARTRGRWTRKVELPAGGVIGLLDFAAQKIGEALDDGRGRGPRAA